MKKCIHCQEEKEDDSFTKSKTCKGGRLSKCKKCRNKLHSLERKNLTGEKKESSKKKERKLQKLPTLNFKIY